MQSVVEDPVDGGRIPVEAGAEPIPTPCGPPELGKMKHELTHNPFKAWRTSCVKGKAQAKPHKRNERIAEDSELPTVQCDYLVFERCCSFRRTESFEHVCEIVWVRHIHSC